MVRLRVYDEPLAVVCAHLASGEQAGDDAKRITSFLYILRNGQFPEGMDGDPEVDERHRCVSQPIPPLTFWG
jgi:hypothetical protein